MCFLPPLSSLPIHIATRSPHVVVCCSSVDAINDTAVRVVSLFSYATVVLLSLYCCCRSCVLLMFPLLGRDCDWCLPVPPFYPLCSCRRSSPYCHCCCYRYCVGAISFYLYRLLCPILAAGVLLLFYVVAAEVLLFFPAIPPSGTTPPLLPGSPIFPLRSAKLQTVPTFLYNYFIIANTRKYHDLFQRPGSKVMLSAVPILS